MTKLELLQACRDRYHDNLESNSDSRIKNVRYAAVMKVMKNVFEMNFCRCNGMTEILAGTTIGVGAGLLIAMGEPLGGISAACCSMIFIGSRKPEEND